MEIEGANNPGNKVHVDSFGKIQARAVSISEQSQKSIKGDAYNINTGKITLTNDVETPLFYFKNDTEDDSLVIPRVFLTMLSSAGGTGEVQMCIYSGVSGGDIVSATEFFPTNFNFSSSRLPGATLRRGATGDTFTGGQLGPELLFPSDNFRNLTSFESIVLPRGASMLITVKAPAGNTSVVVASGCNAYIDGDFD